MPKRQASLLESSSHWKESLGSSSEPPEAFMRSAPILSFITASSGTPLVGDREGAQCDSGEAVVYFPCLITSCIVSEIILLEDKAGNELMPSDGPVSFKV